MTRKVFITNFAEIQYIRVRCQHCGYVSMVSALKAGWPEVERCPACRADFGNDILDVITRLQTSLVYFHEKKAKIHADIELESFPE